MAVFKTELHAPIGTTPFLLTFTQVEPPKGVALVAEELLAGGGKISAIYIDNTANPEPSYLRLWEADPGALPGNRPEFLIPAQASTTVQFSFQPPLDIENLWGAVLKSAPLVETQAPTGTVVTRILLGT